MAEHCRAALRAGFNVIVDASFLRHDHRKIFLDLAVMMGIDPVILDCRAPVKTVRQRILQREADLENISEADLAVLDHQRSHHDPLKEQEQAFVVQVCLDEGFQLAELLLELDTNRKSSKRFFSS
jgi:predicted kinase